MDEEEKNVKEIPLDPPPPEIPPKSDAKQISPQPDPAPNLMSAPASDPRFVPIAPDPGPPSDLNSATPIGHIQASAFPPVGQNPPGQTPPGKSPPTINNFKEAGSGGKVKIILTSIVFLFILTSALPIGLAYNNYKIYSPPKEAKALIDSIIASTPLPKTPRIVLAKTQAKMATLETTTHKTTVEVTTSAKDYPFKNGSLTVSGPLDFKEKKQAKSEADFSGQVAMEGMSFSASASVKAINKILYFKVNELPGGFFLSQVADFKNKWFYIDIQKYEQKDIPQMEETISRLRQVFENYTLKSYAWSQMKSDSESYQLAINPPKNEVVDFIYDLMLVVRQTDKSQLDKSIEKENLNVIVEKLDKFEINLKIDKKSGYISQSEIVLTFSIPGSGLGVDSNQVKLAPDTKTPIELKIKTELSNYNEPQIIEVPQGAQNFEDLAKELEKQLNTLPLLNEATPTPLPNRPTTFNNPLDPTSPVLGDNQTLLDQFLLRYLHPTLN